MSENEKSQETSPNDSPKDQTDDQAAHQTTEPGGITDEQLPEDLQPTEDNPLARHPGQTGNEEDQIGADTESGDAANPSTTMTYGSGDSSSSGDSPEDGRVEAEEDDGSEALDNGGGGAG